MKLNTIDIEKDSLKLIRKNINHELPIFATENYLKSKSDDYGWFVTSDFILPFIIEKKLIFKRLIFTTETIYLNRDLTTVEERAFLNEIVHYSKKNNLCDFIFKAQSNAIFNTYPDNSEYVEWGTYELELQPTMDELLSKFYARDRTKIRKAIKLGVTVRTTDNLEEVYENIKSTFLRQNSLLFPSMEYLEKLRKNLGKNIKFFIVENSEQEIQGSSILLYDKNRAYYLYGGSIRRPTNGSINLMHYRAMEYFKKEGVNYYDFVGARPCVEENSKFEALQKFKSRFGTTLRMGYAFRVVINPLKYRLFKLAVQSYFKLKRSSYIDPIDSIRRCNEQQHSDNS
jgi:lipid II:glycine glycyltransferase (peptidoglycan interpeptide bridge formation enzyme)